MDRLTPEQRRRNMQAIRSTNTKIEVMLGKALWAKGYRYRKNDRTIIGKPDFIFKRQKVAVFCDSEFWHGKDWEILNKRLQTNRQFWVEKIERTIARDIYTTAELQRNGWTVVRFWEKEIKSSLTEVVRKIEQAIQNAKRAPCNSPEIPR